MQRTGPCPFLGNGPRSANGVPRARSKSVSWNRPRGDAPAGRQPPCLDRLARAMTSPPQSDSAAAGAEGHGEQPRMVALQPGHLGNRLDLREAGPPERGMPRVGSQETGRRPGGGNEPDVVEPVQELERQLRPDRLLR